MSSSAAMNQATGGAVGSATTTATAAVTNPYKKRKKHHPVTPNNMIKTSLDHRMSVDKDIVDELLLVCGVIGTTTKANNEFVPVTDCLNWLQDLQRALRRDEDLYRPISLLLGKWKIVEQKLLPLVVTCRYDTALVLTIVKILVILTKPLSENTNRAGQLIIDTNTNSKNYNPQVIEQQKKLRDNALMQAEQLLEYKRHITYHPSHHKKGKNGNDTSSDSGLLSIFVSLLAEPLSKSGASRTDADHLTIELVLHLIRNLLSAEPLLNTSSETTRQATQLHHDMITLFDNELVLDILLVIGQEMELRENSQYNLLVMEILHHLLKGQDPMQIAKSSKSKRDENDSAAASASTTENADPTTKASKGQAASNKKSNRFSSSGSSSSSSILASKLKQEQCLRQNIATVRHGHFGGTWMRKQSNGKRQFVGASSLIQEEGRSTSQQRMTKSKRKNRMNEPFIGSGKSLLVHTRNPIRVDSGSPAYHRANQTLHRFCQRFMADCYGPFMKSLKNEFRRDSVRLEETDKLCFFKLIWFFSQWWRTSSASSKKQSKSTVPDNDKNQQAEAIGRLIITMDMFTFNLVLNATDTFYQHKKFTRLAQTVALYSEMLHLLFEMYTSHDQTEHEMAMGLIDRIFYHGADAIDRLPRLLNTWTPGTFTREYLCDLVEVAHVSLKLLETNTKRGIEFMKNKDTDANKKVSQKIAKLRKDASEFDIKEYFLKKIVSNQMITMYCHLLGQYKVNATVVNHRIIAMFLRLMRLEIALPEVADSDTPINPLGTKRVTLEPMLYHLYLFMVLEQILNDTTIRKDKSFESLLQFSTNIMYKFWTAANTNPMLYVELLFRPQGRPHRHCDFVTNIYVDDELRMMAEREILREEQLQEEQEYGEEVGEDGPTRRSNENDDDDNDDDEVEFTGDTVQAGIQANDESPPSDKKEDGKESDSEGDEGNSEDEKGKIPNSFEENETISNQESRVNDKKRPRDEIENPVEEEIPVPDGDAMIDSPSSKYLRIDTAIANASSDDDVDFTSSRNDTSTSEKGNRGNVKQRCAIEDDDSDED